MPLSSTLTRSTDTLATTLEAGKPVLNHGLEERALFADCFDRKPFLFHHGLNRQELFQVPALLEAAERLSRRNNKSHYESGEPDKNGWFGSRPEGKTMVDALAEIASGKNWVILKRIHEDEAYGAVLAALIPELSELSGVDMASVYYDPTMTIFVTSPGRITPYHMDGETNFLAQVQGTKHVYLYDGKDESVLRAHDLERYWTGNLPKIEYKEELPYGHWQYLLEPGNGVFNPATFPHWLQNGDEVSVSVSINFKRKHDAAIGAHRANKYLRAMGLTPTAPGVSPGLDRVKEATFGKLYHAADGAKKALKDKLGK